MLLIILVANVYGQLSLESSLLFGLIREGGAGQVFVKMGVDNRPLFSDTISLQ